MTADPAASERELCFGEYVAQGAVSSRPFSVTYRAVHRTLGRSVLVRALKPGVAVSSPFADELEREARALAKLTHDGVISLIDYVKEEGAHYIVLEDPRGFLLSELLAAGRRMPTASALAIGLGLARALAYAHSVGIAHRGLRPDVIALTPQGAVKIVNFGRAGFVQGPALVEARREQGGAAALGEPAPSTPQGGRDDVLLYEEPEYMAPEAIVGFEPTPRSDVYALGLLIYEMVSGRKPFPGGGSRERASRLHQPPPAELRGAEGPVSRDLERAVARALAPDPADRFADAAPLAEALEAALEREPAGVPTALVRKALAHARLVEDTRARETKGGKAKAGAAEEGGAPVRTLALLGCLILGGGVLIERALHDGAAASPPPALAYAEAASLRHGGRLRLLARPWAEVYLNGELLDTTPIGRPVPVAPGRHDLTFKHPSAPDERRTIRVVAGQTVTVDVAMRVSTQPLDAGSPSTETP